MRLNLRSWSKTYAKEILLCCCIVLTAGLSLSAATLLTYAVGSIVIGVQAYLIFYLQALTASANKRLLALDKENRLSLLDNMTAYNPNAVIKDITNNLADAKSFIQEIGKGNFEARLRGINESNIANNRTNLAGELIHMREKLRDTAEEERRRGWMTEGLAAFGDLLRDTDNTLSNLSHTVVSFAVKYLNANQGGIFILNDENENDPFLELTAVYAYDRRKYMTRRINPGEGLIGQVYLEQQTTHLKKVPADYINITSGLGHANPNTIIIVPLKADDKTAGVIELASFSEFEKHEIDFCEKIAANMASAIYAVKNNERTRNLLEVAQQQSEEMRAQEEEIRQNMEELQATQEAIILKSREKMDIQQIVEAIPYGIVSVSDEGRFYISNATSNTLLQTTSEVIKDTDVAKHFRFLKQEHLKTGNKLRQKVFGNGDRTFLAEISISKLDTSENRYMLVFRDISQEVKKEQELVSTLEQLEALKITESQLINS